MKKSKAFVNSPTNTFQILRTHPEELLGGISTTKWWKSKKKVENYENWNVDKVGYRSHSAFGIGAKHI